MAGQQGKTGDLREIGAEEASHFADWVVQFPAIGDVSRLPHLTSVENGS